MRIRILNIWLLGFVALIFFMPISLGSLKLLNEPVLVVSTILSLLIIFLCRERVPKFAILVFFFSFYFSAAFLLILIIYAPSSFQIKDFVECFKPLIYAAIFSSGFLISRFYKSEQVVKFLLVAGICSVIFSYLVFIPQAYPLLDFYKARQSDALNSFHFYRFSGTLGYPGGFGYWLVLILQVALLQLYRHNVSFFKFIFFYGFLLSGLILSGSRGAFAVYVLVNIATIVSIPRNPISWVMAVTLFLGLLCFVSFLLVSSVELQSIIHFQKVLEEPTEGTFAHRAGELERLYNLFSDGYILGNGPNNSYIGATYGPIESVYYYYGYKFGMIGLFYYGLWILLVAFILFKLFSSGRKINFPFFFCLWAIVNMTIAGISNSITEEYKSFYLFFLLLGYVSGCLHYGFLGRHVNYIDLACQRGTPTRATYLG